MPILIRCLLAAFLLACAPLAGAAELLVSAAASLTDAFTDIGHAYEARSPGDKVSFNFAASDVLARQIAQGAPVDVFASADQATMDRAQVEGSVRAQSRVDFTRNALVMIVPIDSRLGLHAPRDLLDAKVRRIAWGDPASVPAGRYAREALQAAGAWDAVAAKGVPAGNVRQALAYVAQGEADAGIVFATDAAAMAGKVKIAAPLKTATPIAYPIAITTDSKQADAAARFIAFVRSPEAQRILARHGFKAP